MSRRTHKKKKGTNARARRRWLVRAYAAIDQMTPQEMQEWATRPFRPYLEPLFRFIAGFKTGGGT